VFNEGASWGRLSAVRGRPTVEVPDNARVGSYQIGCEFALDLGHCSFVLNCDKAGKRARVFFIAITRKMVRKEVGPRMSSAKRTRTDTKSQALRVSKALKRAYPEATCALTHANPYQLLVATILSAQCTDARVNMVTPELFARFPSPCDLASAKSGDLEALIRSTGFFRAKTRSLLVMAQQVVDRHDGQIPRSLPDLTALAGVGRKTANVVLGTAFGIASGIVVDTHVKRLARRLGLTSKSAPEQIERELTEVIPRSNWVDFSHRMIQHGRRVCLARRPRCEICSLASICPRVGVTTARTSSKSAPPRDQ
jgi:endonuclease III